MAAKLSDGARTLSDRTIAVLPFAYFNIDRSNAESVTDNLAAEIERQNKLTVVDRGFVKGRLAKLRRKAFSRVGPETARWFRKNLRVGGVVVGTIAVTESGKLKVTAKLVNLATRRIVASASCLVPVDDTGVEIDRPEKKVEQIVAKQEQTLPDSKHKKKTFYNFRLGSHDIGGNTVKFEFPGSGDNLYLFNLEEWKGPRRDKTKLVVNLYDKHRRLVTFSESVCISKNFSSFGSIAFSVSEVSRNNIDKVAYFSISVEDCGQKSSSIYDLGYTSAEEQLEKIYLNYLDALDKKNVEDMKKYMLREGIEEMEAMAEGMGGMDKIFMIMSQMSPRNLKNIEEGIRGDEAILSAAGAGVFGGQAKITITFKKEDGVWKVDEMKTEVGNN